MCVCVFVCVFFICICTDACIDLKHDLEWKKQGGCGSVESVMANYHVRVCISVYETTVPVFGVR